MKIEQKELGELALELISEYPLYASTSNITYNEAIEVAKVFYPLQSEWREILDEIRA